MHRKLRIFVTALAAALAATLLPAVFPTSASAVSIETVERQFLYQINKYRRARGLPFLQMDRDLTEAAEWHSRDMARYNYFSHTDRLGRSPFDRIKYFGYPSNTWRGENLAAGNAGAPATFLQWRNSPGHNANMLNKNYRAIGIARVYNSKARYGYYWTTTFGSRVVVRVR